MYKKIICSVVCSILLAGTHYCVAQNATPFYNKTRFEQKMAPGLNQPLHKMKYALVEEPAQQPVGNSASLIAYNAGSAHSFSFDIHPFPLFYMPFTPCCNLHKVKLDYMPKTNMGPLYIGR